MGDKMKCKECGEQFIPKSRNNVFCCSSCKSEYYYRKYSKYEAKQTYSYDLDRPYTSDTIFLIHKYKAEGMKEKQIADLLNRSVKNVMAALEQPITRVQIQCINEYFNPYRKRNRRMYY